MNPEMKLGEGISIAQEKEFQLMSSWMPITPEKLIPTRSNPVPVDRYGTPLGRADWQELAGFAGGYIEDTTNYDHVLNSSPIGQSRNEGYYNSNTSMAERHRIINHIAASYTQARCNENESWKNNQLANLLARGNAAALASANKTPGKSTSIANRPLDLNLHSQVNNWREPNFGNWPLHNQAYHSGSSPFCKSNLSVHANAGKARSCSLSTSKNRHLLKKLAAQSSKQNPTLNTLRGPEN